MKNYLKNWNLSRVLRLGLGIFIMVEGIVTKEWLFGLAGLAFSLLPVFNVGCCGASGCSTPVQGKVNENEEVNYEEVR